MRMLKTRCALDRVVFVHAREERAEDFVERVLGIDSLDETIALPDEVAMLTPARMTAADDSAF